MTTEDLFGLTVRIGGTVLAVLGSLYLLGVLVRLAGVPIPARYTLVADFCFAAIYIVVGLILFLTADLITRLAYRKR